MRYVVGLVAIGVAFGAAPPPERGAGVVAADHAEASRAGAQLLGEGGNAVDAVVAAALAAGVVQPSASGLGGGGFATWHVDGASGFLDFREVAPGATDPAVYREDPERTRRGGLAVAVPMESRGLATLLRERGRMGFAKVAAPAISLAERGHLPAEFTLEQLRKTTFDAIRARFTVDGALADRNVRVRQRDLARTLRRWAASEGEDLHVGDGAAAIVLAVQASGGRLTAGDLASVRPVAREPLRFRWRGLTVLTAPPPSSGGTVLSTSLRATERSIAGDIDGSGAYHALIEAFQHTYADRARYLGDPDHVDVPVDRLTDDARVAAVAAALGPSTLETSAYGLPVEPPKDAGTQHISVIDQDGGAVALTTTINTGFGSGIVPDGTGIILNNQMDDFAVAPGVPNAYGLVGSAANAIAPGKRPHSSMTPTLALGDDGVVRYAVGASGGAQIPSAVAQVLIGMVSGLDPQEAVARPRFHHQWLPAEVVLELAFPSDVDAALAARGHRIVRRDHYACVQAVARTSEGVVTGGADPRKGGWPAAVMGRWIAPAPQGPVGP